MYGLLMALAMLFMAGLCACSAQPRSAAETAPQTIVVGIDVFDPYSYLDRNGQFAGIDVELATDCLLLHISEPTRRTPISYAVFCLKKKKK